MATNALGVDDVDVERIIGCCLGALQGAAVSVEYMSLESFSSNVPLPGGPSCDTAQA